MASMLSGSSMPQPATFAPSKEDILGALGFYFGQPVSPEKLKDYNEHHAATYHFPDAYVGSNTKIRDTINNLVEKQPQTWHTTIGLPFRRIEGTVVEWDEIRFDVRLMQRVPYQGVSRMTTSMKRKHRDRVVRRGLGMLIESDFYTTAMGREHFSNQIQSIRYCVQETCNYDVLFAAMQHEISMYAIAQKEGNGLDKAVEDCKFRMKRYGVTPNLLVVPPQLSLYMALAPEEKIKYTEGGPQALANFEAGAAGFEARAFRGCGVVTSDPFEVADDQEAVQMLQRFSQVGEFYVLSKPSVPPKDKQKGFMDILIYDEEADRHVKITYFDALLATGLFEAEGTGKKEVKVSSNITLAQGFKADGNQAKDATDFDLGSGETLATYLVKVNALLAKNVDGADAGVAELDDAPVVIARPFLEHAMLSAVLAVSGADTGATIFGPSDMQISANTSVKTIEGHYTGHFKAVVYKPQNVLVMRDIMSNGYRAGGNTKFFITKNDGSVGTLQDAGQAMMRRLNFEEGDGSLDEQPASLLAFPLPEKQYQSGSMNVEMSVTSRLLPWEVNDRKHNSFPGGEQLQRFYENALNLRSVHFGEDLRSTENMEYMSQGSTNNSLCFVGPHRKWDSLTGSYGNLVPGMGHWGPDARPGDARWRRGEAVSMVSARESMMTYEQMQYIPKPLA